MNVSVSIVRAFEAQQFDVSIDNHSAAALDCCCSRARQRGARTTAPLYQTVCLPLLLNSPRTAGTRNRTVDDGSSTAVLRLLLPGTGGRSDCCTAGF
jgi:hypothetical protein